MYNKVMHYGEVFRALNRRKTRYLVIGGLAVNLYGYTRLTIDLDLLIALDDENRDKFFKAMKELGFKAKKPQLAKKLIFGEYQAKGIKVVSFRRKEMELIDVFIENPVDFDRAYRKRKIFKAGRIGISTVPYSILIAMKKKLSRDRDLLDVGNLERIRKNAKKS
jgi:hypothetical protein